MSFFSPKKDNISRSLEPNASFPKYSDVSPSSASFIAASDENTFHKIPQIYVDHGGPSTPMPNHRYSGEKHLPSLQHWDAGPDTFVQRSKHSPYVPFGGSPSLSIGSSSSSMSRNVDFAQQHTENNPPVSSPLLLRNSMSVGNGRMFGHSLDYYKSTSAPSPLLRQTGNAPGHSLFGSERLLSGGAGATLRNRMLSKLRFITHSSRKRRTLATESEKTEEMEPIRVPFSHTEVCKRFQRAQQINLSNFADISVFVELAALETKLAFMDSQTLSCEFGRSTSVQLNTVSENTAHETTPETPTEATTETTAEITTEKAAESSAQIPELVSRNPLQEKPYCPYREHLVPQIMQCISNLYGDSASEELREILFLAAEYELEYMRRKERLFLNRYAKCYVPSRYRSHWRDGKEGETDHLVRSYVPIMQRQESKVATLYSGFHEDENKLSPVEDGDMLTLSTLLRGGTDGKSSFNRNTQSTHTSSISNQEASGAYLPSHVASNHPSNRSSMCVSDSVLPTPDSTISETYFETPKDTFLHSHPHDETGEYWRAGGEKAHGIPMHTGNSFFRPQEGKSAPHLEDVKDMEGIKGVEDMDDYEDRSDEGNSIPDVSGSDGGVSGTLDQTTSFEVFRDPYQTLRSLQSPTLRVLRYDPSAEFRMERAQRRVLFATLLTPSEENIEGEKKVEKSEDKEKGEDKEGGGGVLREMGTGVARAACRASSDTSDAQGSGNEDSDKEDKTSDTENVRTSNGSGTTATAAATTTTVATTDTTIVTNSDSDTTDDDLEYPVIRYRKFCMRTRGKMPYSLATYYYNYVPEVKSLEMDEDGIAKELEVAPKLFLFQKRQKRIERFKQAKLFKQNKSDAKDAPVEHAVSGTVPISGAVDVTEGHQVSLDFSTTDVDGDEGFVLLNEPPTIEVTDLEPKDCPQRPFLRESPLPPLPQNNDQSLLTSPTSISTSALPLTDLTPRRKEGVLSLPSSSPLWAVFFYGLCANRPKQQLSTLALPYRAFHAWKNLVSIRKQAKRVDERTLELSIQLNARRMLAGWRELCHKKKVLQTMRVTRAVNTWFQNAKISMRLESRMVHAFQKEQIRKRAHFAIAHWRVETQAQYALRDLSTTILYHFRTYMIRKAFRAWKSHYPIKPESPRSIIHTPRFNEPVSSAISMFPPTPVSEFASPFHSGFSPTTPSVGPSPFVSPAASPAASSDISSIPHAFSSATPLSVHSISSTPRIDIYPVPTLIQTPDTMHPASMLSPSKGNAFLQMHNSFHSKFRRL